ncbi:related to TY3B TY3B protein [Fusarium oxysporum]|uniref:Related to TY3B TY3B protein n=1 Tax=Fusarium oxysporum TaxID=5507 RepID=A0A2H3TPA1_FUSOX|nr:related to TY3B TY3B protein [Fusarium oxysporum]
MLKKGYIRESSSSAASAIFFIPKKNGKDQPVVDYRPVNARTIKDRTPLPLITELKDRLQGKKIFTALDLKGAYNLIRRLYLVAFYSYKLQGAELNYPIYDKEFLAIVNCFGEFRYYLMGSKHKVKVYTDH